MDYGGILKRGWQIIWEHKFIWILGFIAALGGNTVSSSFNGGGSNSGGSNFNIDENTAPEDLPFDIGPIEDFFEGLEATDPDQLFESLIPLIGGLVALIVCFMIFTFIMWFVRFIAEAGMIQAVFDIESGVKSNFQQAFGQGRPHLLSLFTARIILAAPIIILFILMICGFAIMGGSAAADFGNPDAIAGAFGILAIPFICLICLIVPYSIVTSLIYPVAQRGVVLRGQSPMDSLRHGWDTLKTHTGEMLIMGLIYSVLGIIVGIVSLVVIVPILIGSFAPVGLALLDGGAPGVGGISLAGIGLLAVIIVSAGINAIAVAYRSTTFTLVYMDFMNRQNLVSKTAEE